MHRRLSLAIVAFLVTASFPLAQEQPEYGPAKARS